MTFVDSLDANMLMGMLIIELEKLDVSLSQGLTRRIALSLNSIQMVADS